MKWNIHALPLGCIDSASTRPLNLAPGSTAAARRSASCTAARSPCPRRSIRAPCSLKCAMSSLGFSSISDSNDLARAGDLGGDRRQRRGHRARRQRAPAAHRRALLPLRRLPRDPGRAASPACRDGSLRGQRERGQDRGNRDEGSSGRLDRDAPRFRRSESLWPAEHFPRAERAKTGAPTAHACAVGWKKILANRPRAIV